MADDKLYEEMMHKALQLALRGQGYTSPNPLVGAVVFDRSGIIATGYHARAGGPHAEIVALQKAGGGAKGASLAVNLEPCCHIGRTGPCTDAIIAAGIKEVIYAIDDPFMKVCGRGARLLARHGIRVLCGVGAREATRLNEAYLTYAVTGRPFVVLKTAQSLDGRIATQTGDSRWISCPEALKFAHSLRARYDAVAVGSGAVRADDPQLTVRLVKGRNPLRIVVTASDTLPADLHLFRHNQDDKTIIATTRRVIAKKVYPSATSWPIRQGREGVDLDDLLAQAGRRQVTSLLVEGGGRLATSLLKHGLVDKYYLVMAPMIIGRGIDTVADLGISHLRDALSFSDYGFRRIGTNMLFWGYPRK